MVVVKKVKLNLIEKYLEDVVVSCSQIKVSQEELRYVDSRLKNNKKEFSSGDISSSMFNSKKKSLEKEKSKLNEKIKLNIKNSMDRLDSLRSIMNKIEI